MCFALAFPSQPRPSPFPHVLLSNLCHFFFFLPCVRLLFPFFFLYIMIFIFFHYFLTYVLYSSLNLPPILSFSQAPWFYFTFLSNRLAFFLLCCIVSALEIILRGSFFFFLIDSYLSSSSSYLLSSQFCLFYF